jgi:hypothetical protein
MHLRAILRFWWKDVSIVSYWIINEIHEQERVSIQDPSQDDLENIRDYKIFEHLQQPLGRIEG